MGKLKDWVEGAPGMLRKVCVFFFLEKPLNIYCGNFPAGGVALMTMGFIFNPSAVPPSRVEAILGAFARVEDMRFVVKFEEGEEGIRGVEVPKNVMVLPFVPQKEVLAHKNTR